MIGTIKNRRGIAPLLIVLIIFAVLAIIYIILYIPIPAFKAIRYTINYWAILLTFFAVQVGLIYIYYKGISLFVKGFDDIKKLATGYTQRFKQFIHIKLKI
jgi:hypothetical protein